jgi:squalene cyclase
VLLTGAAVLAIGVCAEVGFSFDQTGGPKDPVDDAVSRGLRWLVSTQGKDGGWGQDGGETSYVRQGEHLESTGNDVANTAVVAEALLHTGSTPTQGPYREQIARAVEFVLKHVEQSPADGLAVTDLRGTQIQRKLGPYIDTFMAAKLLAELDGDMASQQTNTRVRQNLQKCVAKIEKNQLKDGSWNIAGGWAPILGTSMASQGLAIAQAKGAADTQLALAKVDQYSKAASGMPSGGGGMGSGSGGGIGPGSGGGIAGGVVAVTPPSVGTTADTITFYAASAGVPLYQSAQQLEQLSRTEKDRKENSAQIKAINGALANPAFVTGYGSIGGEEFFSWLNISESLRRTGGPEWQKWNTDMKTKLLKLQNEDGTWAGHHCITGRVAVTSAAILLLRADREPSADAPKVIHTSTKN